MKPQFKTLEDISKYQTENQKSVTAMIELIYDSNVSEYPVHISKPYLHDHHTTKDVLKYADDLKQWETEKESYSIKLNNFRTEQSRIYSLAEAYIKEESGLNDIPEQYRDKVYSLAYSDGHDNGVCGVYYKLQDLVEIFM